MPTLQSPTFHHPHPHLHLHLLDIVLAMTTMCRLGHLTFMLSILYVVSRNVKQHIVTEQVLKKLSSSALKFHSEARLSITTVATGRRHLKPVVTKPYVVVILLLDLGLLSLSAVVMKSVVMTSLAKGRERWINST